MPSPKACRSARSRPPRRTVNHQLLRPRLVVVAAAVCSWAAGARRCLPAAAVVVRAPRRGDAQRLDAVGAQAAQAAGVLG